MQALEQRKSIDDYDAAALDAIASVYHGKVNPLTLISSDDAADINELCANLDTWMDTFQEITDYSHGLNFTNWEMASSLCQLAVFNGRRTRTQLDKAVAAQSQASRESDGGEITGEKLDKANATVADLRDRLHFWSVFFHRAKRFYSRTANDLIDQGMHYIDPVWEPRDQKEKRSAMRRMTAAKYYAMTADEREQEKAARDSARTAWQSEQSKRQETVGYKLESVMREIERLREENADLKQELAEG